MTWNLIRLAEAVTLPGVAAFAVAALCWWQKKFFAGTILGAGAALAGFVLFGSWEFSESFRFRVHCQEANLPCGPSHPSDFTRIATYGFIAMTQVMIVFLVAQSVERRAKQGEYDAAWR